MDPTPIPVSIDLVPNESESGLRYCFTFRSFSGLDRYWDWREMGYEFTLGISVPPPPGSTRAYTGNEENSIKLQNSISHGREKENSTNQGRPVETVNMHESTSELVDAARKLLQLAEVRLPIIRVDVAQNEQVVPRSRVAVLMAKADDIKHRLKRARELYPTCPQVGATIAELKRQLATTMAEISSTV